jgi:uncharacterized protein
MEWGKRGAAVVLMMALSQAVWAGFDEGLAAHNRGDYATALREWRHLAEQGHANAQYSLGAMYVGGRGVPKDDVEAIKWYRLAAEQGHADAQFGLAYKYANGEGVPEDDLEAVKWFRKLAQQGHAGAQFFLGAMYRKGEGVPQDYFEAYVWLSLSAANGSSAGSSDRDKAAKRLTPQALIDAQKRAREMWKTGRYTRKK